MNIADIIALLPQYWYAPTLNRETMPYDTTVITEHDDDMQHLIFAPDPETGYPSSQLPLSLQKSMESDVREYVNKYLQPQNGDSNTVSDVKEGFASIIDRYAQYGSEVDSEIERLKDVVKETLQRKEEL